MSRSASSINSAAVPRLTVCVFRAADVLFDSFASDGRVNVSQFLEVTAKLTHQILQVRMETKFYVSSKKIVKKGKNKCLNNKTLILSHGFKTLCCAVLRCVAKAIWSSGLHKSDPRLRECTVHLRKIQDASGTVDRNAFHT